MKNIARKILILTAAMLFSANMFCTPGGVDVFNRSGKGLEFLSIRDGNRGMMPSPNDGAGGYFTLVDNGDVRTSMYAPPANAFRKVVVKWRILEKTETIRPGSDQQKTFVKANKSGIILYGDLSSYVTYKDPGYYVTIYKEFTTKELLGPDNVTIKPNGVYASWCHNNGNAFSTTLIEDKAQVEEIKKYSGDKTYPREANWILKN